MALVLKDRVLETCTSPGTGTITLLGAVTGYQAFSTVGNGNTCYYAIADQNGPNWECGIGTYSSGTLARTTVLSSSNAGSLTNFSTGSQNVFLTYPSERSVNLSSAALTSGRVTYATTDGLLTDSASLTFDGTNLSVTSPSTATTFTLADNGGRLVVLKNALGAGGNAEVGTTTNHDFYVRAGAGAAGLNSLYLQAGGVTGYSLSYAGLHAWFNGATQAMTLNTSGNLGIGTSSPSVKLHVSGTGAVSSRTYATDATGDASFFVGNNDSKLAGPLVYGSTKTAYGALGSNETAFYSNVSTTIMADGASQVIKFAAGGNTERMRITSDGNLAIGTTSTTGLVTLGRAGGGQYIGALDNNTGYEIGYIQFNSDNMTLNPQGGASGTTGYFRFNTSNVERMRIDSSGNLALGISSGYRTAAGYVALAINATSGSLIDLYASGTRHGGVAATGGGMYVSSVTATPLIFSTTDIERMRIDSAGLVGIGTSAPYTKLHVLGTIKTAPTNQSGVVAFGGTTDATTQLGIFRGAANSTSDGNFLNIAGYEGLTFSVSAANIGSQVERARIDNSGLVGIGTNSPSSYSIYGNKLVVYGTGTNGPGITIATGTADTGTLFFADGTTGTETYRGSVGYAHSDDALLFGTAATERMRIDTSGSLLVGTTSFTAGGKGFVVRNDNAGGTYTQIGATSTSAWDVAYFYNPNGLVGSITVSGSATAYNTSSDQRLKTNIVNAPSGNIDDIKVRSFDWIADGSHQEYGMVAQELLEVAPYAVNKPENPNEMMGVDYSKLVPMMVKEIQDLKAEVNQLKAKIGV